MPKVRVTMFENPIDVPDDEVSALRAQGLLVEDEEPAGPPAGTLPVPGTPAPRKSADDDKETAP